MLSTGSRSRLTIATTDRAIGEEIADAIDSATATHVPSFGELYENNDPNGSLVAVAVPGTYYPWVTATPALVAGPGLVTSSGSTLVIGADGAGVYKLLMTSTLSSSGGGGPLQRLPEAPDRR